MRSRLTRIDRLIPQEQTGRQFGFQVGDETCGGRGFRLGSGGAHGRVAPQQEFQLIPGFLQTAGTSLLDLAGWTWASSIPRIRATEDADIPVPRSDPRPCVKMKANRIIVTVLAGLLAGCAVGPNYQRPSALKAQPLPDSFAGAGTNAASSSTAPTNLPAWKPAAPAADQPRGPWWEAFGDKELNRLESLAAADNQKSDGTGALGTGSGRW